MYILYNFIFLQAITQFLLKKLLREFNIAKGNRGKSNLAELKILKEGRWEGRDF